MCLRGPRRDLKSQPLTPHTKMPGVTPVCLSTALAELVFSPRYCHTCTWWSLVVMQNLDILLNAIPVSRWHAQMSWGSVMLGTQCYEPPLALSVLGDQNHHNVCGCPHIAIGSKSAWHPLCLVARCASSLQIKSLTVHTHCWPAHTELRLNQRHISAPVCLPFAASDKTRETDIYVGWCLWSKCLLDSHHRHIIFNKCH